MATLHTVTELSKNVIKYGGLFLAAVSLFFIGINIGKTAKTVFFPRPVAPPTTTFGKLPAIQFPNNVTDKKFTYIIDTLTGRLPAFQSRIQIYKLITHENPSLLEYRDARQSASAVGFTRPDRELKKYTLQWDSAGDLERSLIINLETKDFTMTSPFLTQENVRNGIYVVNEANSIKAAQEFLSKMAYFPPDVDVAKTKTYRLSVIDGKLIPAGKKEAAPVIEVDFFQRDLNKLPIFYYSPFYSQIKLFVGFTKPLSREALDNKPEVVETHFSHQKISDIKADYPLKSTYEAYNELVNGKGYVAAYFGDKTEIKIKDVVLGYYLNGNDQNYLMPVYVFKGLDDSFYGYVSALKNEWIK
ncbi:MAG: hypothetical protein HY430_02495 [Candidatus Levybacteria bacterium]|nr:hypothetical protein [Candidatus Levybacteria bacterium]